MNKSECVCAQEANSHRTSLESEVKTRTAAMETFDQMNSSLISANLSLQVENHTSPGGDVQLDGLWIMDFGLCSFVLQKSLLENCQDRVDARGEVKSLRSTFEKTQEKLRDKERALAAAQAENQTLKLQVICTARERVGANIWAQVQEQLLNEAAAKRKLHVRSSDFKTQQSPKERRMFGTVTCGVTRGPAHDAYREQLSATPSSFSSLFVKRTSF